jgi:hypothetical protein
MIKYNLKNIFKNILIATQKAYSTPTLPDNIIKIQSYPIIRMMRFLGGISFLMILTKTYINFHFLFLYILYFFALIFTIYHYIIAFYRFKHIISLLKTDKLDIRNSPLNRLATLGAKALLCLKGTCEAAQPLGITLGLMISTDTLLKEANREPIFTPLLAGALNKILSVPCQPSTSQMIETEIARLNQNSIEIKDLNKAIEIIDKSNGDLSVQEVSEFKKILIENRSEIIQNNEKIKENIINNLKNK